MLKWTPRNVNQLENVSVRKLITHMTLPYPMQLLDGVSVCAVAPVCCTLLRGDTPCIALCWVLHTGGSHGAR